MSWNDKRERLDAADDEPTERCRGQGCGRWTPIAAMDDGVCQICAEDHCACPQCGVVILREDLEHVAGDPCCSSCAPELQNELERELNEDEARHAGSIAINEIEGWR